MIISGGVNIYPQECENLLIEHPKVADAAVFGVPNADLGEEVKAVVQMMPGEEADDAMADELITHCREHLAAMKCPREHRLYRRNATPADWKAPQDRPARQILGRRQKPDRLMGMRGDDCSRGRTGLCSGFPCFTGIYRELL